MKGQESIAAVSVLILVIVGVGGLIQTNNLVFQVAQNNTGDYNTILDADIRTDYYPYLVRKELNYTSDIVALETVEWSQNIPSTSEAREDYTEKIETRLRRQTELLECESPQISEVSVEDTSVFRVNLEDRMITCETENTRTSIPLDSDTELEVENVNNRYTEALAYSSNYTRNLKKRLDSFNGFSTSAEGSSSTCDGESLQDAKDEAKDSAVDAVRSNVANQVRNERNDGDELSSDWISIRIRDYLNNEERIEISASCSYTTSSNEDEDLCGEDSGTEYDAECELGTDSVTIGYSIRDNENEIYSEITETTPVYDWRYTYYN